MLLLRRLEKFSFRALPSSGLSFSSREAVATAAPPSSRGPFHERSPKWISLQCRTQKIPRRTFMSRPWYIPTKADALAKSDAKPPVILYENIQPWRTRLLATLTTGNFAFFAYFMEQTNMPGSYIEEIPYSGYIGFFGVAGSAVILSGNMRSRSHNIVRIAYHEEDKLVEMSWHTFLGGIVSKYCPVEALKISAYSPTNKDSENLFFRVPYERGNFAINRYKGKFHDEERLVSIFGKGMTPLDQD